MRTIMRKTISFFLAAVIAIAALGFSALARSPVDNQKSAAAINNCATKSAVGDVQFQAVSKNRESERILPRGTLTNLFNLKTETQKSVSDFRKREFYDLPPDDYGSERKFNRRQFSARASPRA